MLTVKNDWITDENGNKASIKHWGTKEAARHSLTTLKNCKNCSNCASCHDCTDCHICTSCHNCTNCSTCAECKNCSYCSHCVKCGECEDCSHLRQLNAQKMASRYTQRSSSPLETSNIILERLAAPPIPFIKDLDAKVFAEVYNDPHRLDMSNWHTPCGTVHCRAGWVCSSSRSGRA